MNTATVSTNVDPVLDATPLSDNHEIKFLQAARLEFTSERPPFARRNKNEGPKVVTLAVGSGQLPKTAILATLVTRKWDTKNSFYTLDRNGERLTVKPYGGISVHKDRGGNPYRTRPGQGNVFGESPIAFAFKGDTDEQPSNRKDVGAGLESTFGEFSIQGSDYLEEEGYSSTTSEGSGLESQAHRGSKSQEATIKPTFPETSATQGRLARLNTNCDNPSPSESSTAAPQISEVAAGKRPASDTIDEDRSPKRVHPLRANTFINSPTAARVPPTLTSYKQERTSLHVVLPGSNSEMVPIKLRSAMTLSTFFSSVSAAAGVLDHEEMAIAVKFGGEDGGQDKTIIVKRKRNMIDTFEFLLEIVDEATCWEEEGGGMALQLQLRWPSV